MDTVHVWLVPEDRALSGKRAGTYDTAVCSVAYVTGMTWDEALDELSEVAKELGTLDMAEAGLVWMERQGWERVELPEDKTPSHPYMGVTLGGNLTKESVDRVWWGQDLVTTLGLTEGAYLFETGGDQPEWHWLHTLKGGNFHSFHYGRRTGDIGNPVRSVWKVPKQ